MDTMKLHSYQHKHAKPVHLGIGENFAKVATMAKSDTWEDTKMAYEISRRYNAFPELVATLENLELRTTQARIASNIGQPRLKDADFLRSELERMGQAARQLLNTLNQ